MHSLLFTILPIIAQLYQTQQLRITCSYMFRHLKCHPQGAHCALLKLHTDFSGLSKIKLLKYKNDKLQ